MTAEPAKFFGLRLRELREAAGLSQPQLAERAGIGPRTISHLEQGRNMPTWASVVALAAALGVHTDAFLTPPASAEPRQGRGRPKKPDVEPEPVCV